MRSEQGMSERLREAMADANLTVEAVAQATKVPRSTLRYFLGEDVNAILPARVYLRGHLSQVAREVGIGEAEALALFDAQYPVAEREDDGHELPRFSRGTVALAAGVASVGIVAVLLAFAG